MRLFIEHVFDDDESRILGLQHKMLPADSCALFVYDGQPLPRRFWMKGVPVNLYLSAIADEECIFSELMHANTTSAHSTPPCSLVIESRVEIPEGSPVSIDGDWLVF